MNNQKSNTKPHRKYNVVIVGSGFSGIVAAGILAEQGLDVLLLDENLHVGGQLLRKVPPHLGEYASNYRPDYVKRIGFRFVENVKNKKITIMNRTTLLGVYPDKRILLEIDGKDTQSVSGEVILFATGARERYLPFKGWTLPGVYSAGMVQVLMKSSGILPAKRIMVGGSGLFLYSVAYEILKNKGKVPALLEQSGMMDKIKMVPALLHHPSKLTEGARYMSKIMLSGVPVKFRRKIVEARGNGAVEEVVTGKCDASGKLITGTEKIYKTDAVAVGYGFVPNIEGPQMAGCDIEYSQSKGGWIVRVDDALETSVENILAAGEITGVGGALKSIDEGEIAALTILKKLDKIQETEYNQRWGKLSRKRKHHMDFVYYFNHLYRVPAGALEDIPGDTVICRCEDVTMEQLRQGVSQGFTTPKGLKNSVRAGMGNCQGRTCGPVIYDTLLSLTDHSPGSIGPFTVRPPLKPVSIDALAGLREKES